MLDTGPSKSAMPDDQETIGFYRGWVIDAHEVLREAITGLEGSEKLRLMAVADVMQMKLTLPETHPDSVVLPHRNSGEVNPANAGAVEPQGSEAPLGSASGSSDDDAGSKSHSRHPGQTTGTGH